MKDTAFIETKKNMIQRMIDSLQANEKVLHRIGGFTVESKNDEIEFQQARLSVLTFAETASEEEILTEIHNLESQLAPEELVCKGGIVRGLSLEKILLISKLELLELCIVGGVA